MAVFLLVSAPALAQPGDNTVQHLREELDRLRTELVRQHQEFNIRNQALRQELALCQQESQALLSQLLDAQKQLSLAVSGEELARIRVEKESLEAQLSERKAALVQMQDRYAAELAAANGENEALLAQLLAAQAELRQQKAPQLSEDDPDALIRQIRSLEARLRQINGESGSGQPGITAGQAGSMPAAVMAQGDRAPAAVAQKIRSFFAERRIFPVAGAVLQFEAASLPDIYPESLYLRFVIETDPVHGTVVKCVAQTADGVFLSDRQASPGYDAVGALLRKVLE